MEPIDIWRAADVMMKFYRAEAMERAVARAEALAGQGDQDGYFAWKRIARALDDLGRERSEGEPPN